MRFDYGFGRVGGFVLGLLMPACDSLILNILYRQLLRLCRVNAWVCARVALSFSVSGFTGFSSACSTGLDVYLLVQCLEVFLLMLFFCGNVRLTINFFRRDCLFPLCLVLALQPNPSFCCLGLFGKSDRLIHWHGFCHSLAAAYRRI